MPLPRQLDTATLEREAQTSLLRFVRQRVEEGTGPYREAFLSAQRKVVRLFRESHDLHDLNVNVLRTPGMTDAARYLGGPPISDDDLRTLATVDGQGGPPSPESIIEVLHKCMDPFRFPWMSSPARRQPTKRERATAVEWTSSLWAVEKCRTARRTESSARQEHAVAELFARCGLQERAGVRSIGSLDELPRGSFVREVRLGEAKADLAARLADGRLVAAECKVSNSAINSVKRLNREAVGKAAAWRNLYGLQVVPVVVLAGVFRLTNLVDAQNAGVFIFWEHAMNDLGAFVEAHTRPPQ